MPAKIRLKRTGRRGQSSFRVVVLDESKPRDARVVDDLGYYDPKTTPSTCEINDEGALQWLKKGAQPTPTARDLLSKAGVMKALDDVRRGEVQDEEGDPEA